MDTYLLIKYLKCSTTPDEERQVKQWLADDPDGSHAKQYSDAHFIYEGMLIHNGQSGHKTASGRLVKAGKRTRRIIAAAVSAAACLLLVAGTGLATRDIVLSRLSSRMESLYVPAGKSMQITLEDGTHLWLNSGTEIEYPSVFSRKSRNVKVNSGEVMFDVARDERRPFIVDTYASTISVLGTKFNVAVDEYAGGFSVALLRGSVKVGNKLMPSEEYVLCPNQMVRLKDDHMYVEYIESPDAVECWTNGLIDIAGIPFDQLMRKFELAYDVHIVIERENLPEIRYTRGKVRVSDGIGHALSMLALVSDFTYEFDRQNGTIVIR